MCVCVCNEELIEYQVLQNDNITDGMWESTLTIDGKTWHYRLDVIWAYLHGSTSANGLILLNTLGINLATL